MTVFEKINLMSVEEFADYMARMMCCPTCPIKAVCADNDGVGCRNVYRKWLESEAEE